MLKEQFWWGLCLRLHQQKAERLHARGLANMGQTNAVADAS